MTGRQYRASVISGCRRALHNALERTDRDLETAINGLLVRLGASGRVGDDVLGCVPDDWPSTPLYVRVGTADRKHDGLRHSVEFLESQPWLPASARYLAESVLKAIGRPSVRALVDRLPEPGPVAWQSLCGWAHPRRRDLPRKAADGAPSPGAAYRLVAVGLSLGRAAAAAGALLGGWAARP